MPVIHELLQLEAKSVKKLGRELQSTRIMKYYCFLTSLSILAALILHCSADSNLVQQTCQRISKKDPNIKFEFCVSALQSDPSSRTAGLEQLAFISLKLGISKATSFPPKIQALLKDGKIDGRTKKILNGCLEYYSNAKNELQDALQDFKVKDYGQGNVDLSAALDYAKDCGDDFEEAGRASPLAREDDGFSQLIEISLSFSNLLR